MIKKEIWFFQFNTFIANEIFICFTCLEVAVNQSALKAAFAFQINLLFNSAEQV